MAVTVSSGYGASLVKRHPRQATDVKTTDNHRRAHHHKSRSHGVYWVASSSVLKATLLTVAAIAGFLMFFMNFGPLSLDAEMGKMKHRVKNANKRGPPDAETSRDAKAGLGDDDEPDLQHHSGWRLPGPHTLKTLGPTVCNIPRISVRDLSPERFKNEFRFKKPVMVTFPNRAAGWTDPHKWSKAELMRTYGQSRVTSGGSERLALLSAGNYTHTFEEFVNGLMRKTKPGSAEPKYYIFDRAFYNESNFSSTLNPPPYLSFKQADDLGTFILGASRSGLYFHRHQEAWNGVVFGMKRWLLYPLSKTTPGGGVYGTLDWIKRIYPNLTRERKPLECVQSEGDIIYVPEGYMHATLNVGDTVGVGLIKRRYMLRAGKLDWKLVVCKKNLDGSPDKISRERFQKCLNILMKLHKMFPENSEFLWELSRFSEVAGRHDLVRRHLQDLIRLDPYHIFAYGWIGTLLEKQGRYKEAESAFLKALRLNPDCKYVNRQYALFLLNRNRLSEAVHILKRGTDLEVDMLPIWMDITRALQLSGDAVGVQETQKIVDQLKENQS